MESTTDLAAEAGVSRKFVYEQKGKASAALDEAFAIDASDEEVQLELKVTRRDHRISQRPPPSHPPGDASPS